jgi:hypothetical protein
MKELWVSQLHISSPQLPSWDAQGRGMARDALFSSELQVRVILTSLERDSKDHLILRLADKVLTFAIEI